MAFNPSLPATNTAQSSAEMRAQFTGLKDLIDAVPGSPEIGTAVATELQNLVATVSPMSLIISDPPTRVDQLIQALGSGS